MEPKGGGPRRPASSNEAEHTENAPGIPVVTESSDEEMLTGLKPRDRIYVVALRDGQINRPMTMLTVLKETDIDRIEEVCAQIDEPFHRGVLRAAYTQVCVRIWGGMPPAGTEAEQVLEVSRTELRRVLQEEAEGRERALRGAS